MKRSMKKLLLTLTLTTALPWATTAADFLGGNLLVVRVGDGTTTLANNVGPLSILEITAAGGLQQSVNIPSGSGGLQTSGTATSEGALVRNADGNSWTVAGYVPPFGGSGSLSSRTAANAPRGYVTINSSATLSSVTTLPSAPYSGQNIRSGLASGSTTWFTGSGTASGSGLTYADGASTATIQGVNARVLNLHNGDLYYSTGSGAQGLYKYSGTPTTATAASSFLVGLAGQGTSPYDFAFAPDGSALYVVDNAIGVQKFTFDGSVWRLAYNLTGAPSGSDRAYGLAVDFSGPNPEVYWTTPTDLWKVTDLGAAATGTSILSAGPNYAFRGLDMVSVPEPTTAMLLVLGAAGVWAARSKRPRR